MLQKKAHIRLLYQKNEAQRRVARKRSSLVLTGLFVVFGLYIFTQSTIAAFNPQMNYQGKLTDSDNKAVTDGTYHMRFRLYTVESGGTEIWEGDRSYLEGNRVTVTNGLFSVLLGSSTALTSVDFDQTLYLEVSIGGTASSSWETLLPRKKLGAVPAAFVADTLDGIDSAQFLRSDEPDTMASSSASTLLTITQTGSGDILNLSNGSEVFTVLNDGRVGIGTTTPTEALVISGTGKIKIGDEMSNPGGKLRVTLDDNDSETQGIKVISMRTTGTNYGYNGTAAGVGAAKNIGLYSWASGATQNWGLWVQSGDAIFEGDYVGIGTTSPVAKLSVTATAGQTHPIFTVASSSQEQYFTITSDGKVGVGTSSPAYSLDVYGDTRVDGNLSLTDDKKLYLDTVKTKYITHSSAHTDFLMNDDIAWVGDQAFYANTGVDGSGSWAPYFSLSSLGYVTIANEDQGNVADRYLRIEFDNGVKLENTSNDIYAHIKADNLAATDKTFQFPNYSGEFLIGTTTGVTIDYANNRLGIGTTSPYAKLSVTATAGQTNPIFTVASSSQEQYFTIASDGKVGIGTSSPAYALDVYGDARVDGDLYTTLPDYVPYTGATADVDLGSNNLTANYLVTDPSSWGFTFSNAPGLLGFADYTGDGASMYLYGSSSIPLVMYGDANGYHAHLDISALVNDDRTFAFPDVSGTLALLEAANNFTATNTFSGKVGIGTSSPYAKLSVTATAGQTNPIFTVASSSEDQYFTIDSSGNVTLATGKNFTIGTTQWNSADEMDGTKIKDADYGDISVSAGGAWTIDGDAVTLGTDTFGHYVIDISDAGNSTIVADGGVGLDGLNYTLDVVGVNCVGCLGTTQIQDIYLLNNGDTATGNYNFDSGTFVVDASSDKVGIGTSSPYAKLSVTATGGQTNPIFTVASSSQEQYFTITSDGKVGVGTSTPTEKLHLHDGNFLQTPADPTLVGSLGIGGTPNSVYVSGRYAYVVDSGSYDLKIIDVSDPSNPTLSGSLSIGTYPRSVYVSGRYAYVVDYNSDDLKVIDVSDPSNPTLSGSLGIGDGPSSVYVSGKYAYVVDYVSNDLKIIDVSDPSNPTLSGSLSIGDSPQSIYVSGRYAYVADNNSDDLKVIDVSDSSNPTLSGSLSIGGSPRSVYVSGRYAYVTDMIDNDLKIINVSSSTAPTLSGSLSIGDSPQSIYVSGRYAYVVDSGSYDLKIIDVSSSTAPTLSGSFGLSFSPYSVYVSGRYAYVIDTFSNDLKIIDISGIETTSAIVHSLEAGNLQVRNDIIAQGQLQITGGAVIGTGGLYSQGSGAFSMATSSAMSGLTALSGTMIDSNTNSIADIMKLTHSAYGTAASGIGAGLLFALEDVSGTATNTARIASLLTNTSTTSPASALTFSTKNTAGTLTEWMRINEDGKVGIGTSSPAYQLDVYGNARVDGTLTIKDDLSISTNGSSPASPRVGAFTNLSSGEAARFQFGDEHNAFQNSYANDVNIYSYWGLTLTGGMQNYNTGFNPMPFSKHTDVGVIVLSDSYVSNDPSNAGNPIETFAIKATTSQLTNLMSFRDSNNNKLSVVDYEGKFSIGTNATSTYSLNVVGGSSMDDLTVSNKVGIGTTSPAAKLSVTATASQTNPIFAVASSSESQYFTITSDGKVGIGTSSPMEKLQIAGDGKVLIGDYSGSNPGGKLRVEIADGETETQAIKTLVLRTTGTNYGYNGTAAGVGAAKNIGLYSWASGATENWGLWVQSGDAIFEGDYVGIGTTSPVAKLSVTATTGQTNPVFTVASSSQEQYFTIASDGKVGVGTANPDTKLHVEGGSLRINNGGSGTIEMGNWSRFSAGDSGYTKFISSGDGFQLFNNTQTSELMHVTNSTGNVGIGTSSPIAKLSVTATAGQTNPIFTVASSSQDQYFTITSDGKVGIGTTTPERQLDILHTVANAQQRISYDATKFVEFYVNSTGDLEISTVGEDVRILDENLWVCTGGGCGATAPADKGNVIVETALIFDNDFKLKQTTATSVTMYDSNDNVLMIFDE